MKKPTIVEASAVVGAVVLSAFAGFGIYKLTQPSKEEICAEFRTKNAFTDYKQWRSDSGREYLIKKLKRLGIYDRNRHEYYYGSSNAYKRRLDLSNYCLSLNP